MKITEAARDYVQKRNLSRTVIHCADRFAAVIGNIRISRVTQHHIEKFKDAGKVRGWTAWTIKGTCKDIRTLARHYCGRTFELRVPVPKPKPDPTSIEVINAIWPHMAPWSRQWLVLAYWCSLRLDDSIRLQLSISDSSVIEWEASKTGKLHQVPVPGWLRSHLTAAQLPYRRAADHAQVIVRAELARVSNLADVPIVFPRNIRQRGLTEWQLSGPDAGAIIHGSGLGILDHYVPGVVILEKAMHRVRLPSCFGATPATAEDSLLNNFRRCDPAAQTLIVGTTERLAAG